MTALRIGTRGSALRIGTRGSALAMAQSRQIGEQVLAGTEHDVELVQVRTTGDVDRRPLTQIGGTGVFVTAVRQALLEGRVDVVVHSMKDLPTLPEPGISVACVPAREDPRDALISRGGVMFAQLPSGARIGTGSPRRAAQLRAARPDVEVVPIRGNIDTRMQRALGPEADLDAVVLAAAGLQRVGRGDEIAELLDPSVMLPAPAQGALALEVRTEDLEGLEGAAPAWFAPLLTAAEDPATRAAATAERALLRALEAGCSAPVAAYAQVVDVGDVASPGPGVSAAGVSPAHRATASDPRPHRATASDSCPHRATASDSLSADSESHLDTQRTGESHPDTQRTGESHPDTQWSRTTETAGAGTSPAPSSAASRIAPHLHLRALAISPDGRTVVAGERTGPVSAAAELGRDLAAELLGRGADRLLAALHA